MAGSVVIVGSGIAGLSITSALVNCPGIQAEGVGVLEASTRAGGHIRSERRDGYLCEWGPNGFLDDAPASIAACTSLGLGARMTIANDDARARFVVRAGRLRKLPSRPTALIGSDILSARGRIRLVLESLVPRAQGDADESVLAFARRRLGREAAAILVDALVTGIWAGDASKLSLRSAFPEIAALEREHGGIIRGLIARRRAGPRGRLVSFPEGLEELPDAFAASLGSRLRLGVRVTGVEPLSAGGFRVSISGAPSIDAAAVVLACPAWAAAPLLLTLDPELSTLLSGIPSVPVAVVHLGFAATNAKGLTGFGFLVPRGEHPSVLGVLIPSNIFPNRAPDGHLLATVMIGGARDPSSVGEGDDRLFDKAGSALRAFVGVSASPRFAYAIRHERAIPQYVIGHAARLAAIDARLREHPGLFLAGNSYRGVSINACLAEARPIAERVAASLR